MRWRTRLASVALGAAAAVLTAQEKPAAAQEKPPTASTQTTQTTTQQNADGSATTVTVTGEVVRYEPGRTIVIRDPNKGEVTYTLEPSLTVPADVAVGRRVRIFSEPGDGSVKVQRITTVTTSSVAATAPADGSNAPADGSNAMPPASNREKVSSTTGASGRQTTTTTTQSSSAAAAAPSAAQTRKTSQTTQTTKTTTVSGTVQAYEPGQSITVIGPGSKTTTYTITQDSRLPEDVAVGKTVTVQTTVVSGKPVVQSVRYRTTTKTTNTRTKSVSPQ